MPRQSAVRAPYEPPVRSVTRSWLCASGTGQVRPVASRRTERFAVSTTTRQLPAAWLHVATEPVTIHAGSPGGTVHVWSGPAPASVSATPSATGSIANVAEPGWNLYLSWIAAVPAPSTPAFASVLFFTFRSSDAVVVTTMQSENAPWTVSVAPRTRYAYWVPADAVVSTNCMGPVGAADVVSANSAVVPSRAVRCTWKADSFTSVSVQLTVTSKPVGDTASSCGTWSTGVGGANWI